METGDKVEVTKSYCNVKKGMQGVLRKLFVTSCWAVEMNSMFEGGHTCSGNCETNKGYWVFQDSLKLIA